MNTDLSAAARSDSHSGPTPSVSVIVPVYKCLDTLEKCLDSLVTQTLESIEIIVVNDGSPDDEQPIIDQYVSKYPDRFVSLIKENGGLSDARNFGVRRARGDYIGFVDSDDFVEPDMFRRLYDAALSNECDISIGKYIHYGLNGSTSTKGRLPVPEGTVFPGYKFLLSQRSMVVWNKIYKRHLLEQFPQPITWFEDVAWTPVVMTHSDRVCFVDEAFYHYVRREGSIASSHDDPRTLQGISSLEYAIQNCAPEHRDAVVYMALRRLLFEADVRPGYADRYLGAIKGLQEQLRENQYLQDDDWLLVNSRPYLSDFPIIPKTIYSSTMSSEPTELEARCIESWQQHLIFSDGRVEIVDAKTVATVGDPELIALPVDHDGLGAYLCLLKIYEEGGVYLDPRLLGHGFIAKCLLNAAFFAFDTVYTVGGLALGATPGHPLIAAIIERLRADMLADQRIGLAGVVQEVLTESFDPRLDGSTQVLEPGVTLYSPSYFSRRFGPENVTSRLYEDFELSSSDGSPVSGVSEGYLDEMIRRLEWRDKRIEKLTKDLGSARRELNNIKTSNRWRIVWRFGQLDRLSFIDSAAYARRALKSGRTSDSIERRERYGDEVENLEVDEDLLVFESFYGRGLISNPYALFLGWSRRPDFQRRRVVWVLDDLALHEDTMADTTKKWPNVSFVERGSKEYYSVLARAKYLVNDVTFFFDFVKRPQQVYINTWHSITAKSLGFDVPGRRLDQKNVVRNMLMCDYFLAANDFVRDDTLLRAHRMDGIFPGKVIVEGHPRNDLTFDTDREEIYKELARCGIEVDPMKQTVLYAPTWRGTRINNPTDDIERYKSDLERIRNTVGDRYNVLIRLHQATHTKLRLRDALADIAVPPTIDANRMFAAVDVLITDYSSIFFDFMVTKRPILFYFPDRQEYQISRGGLIDASQLPGPAFEDVDSLAGAIADIDRVAAEWQQRYADVASWSCPRDDGHVSERVLDVILDGREDLHTYDGYDERKPRILIFAGSLAGGRMSAKAHNLASLFDSDYFDVSVLVDDSTNSKVQWNVGKLLDAGVRVIGRSSYTIFTRQERILMSLDRPFRSAQVPRRMFDAGFRREWRRCLGDAKFDASINLNGDDLFFLRLLDAGDTPRKFVWNEVGAGDGLELKSRKVKKLLSGSHGELRNNHDAERLRTALLSESGREISRDPDEEEFSNG